MRTTLPLLLLGFGLVLPVQAAAPADPAPQAATSTAKPWPLTADQLKADPRAVWGRLDNGLRYVILPNREAPGRASLDMYLDVGSLMEQDNQRGVAHFLEHMAFNGTKHFAAGDTFEYFQRLGMSFGAHTNAATYLNKTVYQLELPRANEELTGDGLKLFRDFLDGILLDEKEIERERGVIQSEILARNTVAYRTTEAMMQANFAGTVVPNRLPLGTADSVRGMKRQQFVDFYETWYTPGRTVLVAVGDFKVDMVERLIKEHFADAKARRGEQPDPNFGQVKSPSTLTPVVHADPDAQNVTVALSVIRPDVPVADSVAARRLATTWRVINTMLNQRFRKLVATHEAAIESGSASHARPLEIAQIDVIGAECQSGQWSATLEVVEQELRRAMKFGFTDEEFAETKTTLLAAEQTTSDQSATQRPNELAAEIVSALERHEVFTSAADDLALMKSELADLKKDDCERLLRETWDTPNRRVIVEGNPTLTGDASQQIVDAYRRSADVPVKARSEQAASRWAYTDFGPAGEIVKRKEVKDLDFVQAEFANHVRVNVKRTSYEKNNVHVIVHFGNGLLELPADKAGLMLLANRCFINGGLQAHSLTELNRAVSDKNVSVRFSVGEDSFQLGGSCSPEALDLQMQVCTAFVAAPGFRPEAGVRLLDSLDELYAQVEHTSDGVVSDLVFSFLRSDDPRFRLPPRADMKRLTLDDLRTWLAQPLKTGYMEVTIVGDVDPDVALKAVGKTLGALPERQAEKPAMTEQRSIHFPTGVKSKDFTYASPTPRALSLVCWPTHGNSDMRQSRRMNVLGSVLNDRLRIKVRQELGATYTPEVVKYGSDSFRDYGYLASAITVDPKLLAEINRKVVEIANDLATGSISDDEFDRAIKPILSSLDDLDNNHWLNVMLDCQANPEFVDQARSWRSDYLSVTKAEIEALAKESLEADKALAIGVAPTPPAEEVKK